MFLFGFALAFVLLLFVDAENVENKIFKNIGPILSITHSHNQCSWSSKHDSPEFAVEGGYIHDYASKKDALGFKIRYIRFKQSLMELYVVDYENYTKFQNNQAFNGTRLPDSRGCDIYYAQMEESQAPNHWHVLAKCVSRTGCKAILKVTETSCSTRGKKSCENAWACGYCSDMNETKDSGCVPSGPYSPNYGIQCEHFKNDFGSFISYTLYGLAFCVCFTTYEVFYCMCRRRRIKRKKEKEANFILPLL
eukprot:TRINITY_DN781822_c0_g1_i1.p1 TRINITY_DN781822_c0_g1~~TRINITY_DN781822_c0_g1_i1.p1  ORF type:complete len:250 (-),score=23.87 TRINITY_DN781822_c0_g1_i1:152-901(-)